MRQLRGKRDGNEELFAEGKTGGERERGEEEGLVKGRIFRRVISINKVENTNQKKAEERRKALLLSGCLFRIYGVGFSLGFFITIQIVCGACLA